VAFIDAKTHEKMSGTWVEPGDVLLNITGASIGRCSVVPSDFDIANVSQHVAIVRLADKDLTRFLHLCICSPYFQKTIMAVQVGVSREGLSMKRLQDFLVPLPPLAEQKRIVARVDQLMALIDQLEAKQNRKRDLGARFTKASLEALTTAESPQDFTTAWTRIHKTWPTLLDCAERIVQIRKAIVALALRGKLLPQAASEGTVEGLLQILARHGLAVRQAGIDGLPSLPDSWAWVHLGSLVTFGPKNGYSPKAVDRPTKVKSLTLSATTSGAFDGSFFKYIDEDVPDDSDLWLSDGDILVQRGNTIDYVGVAAVFRGPKRTFIYPDLMMKIRIDPELDLDFIHLALNGPSAREFIVSRASGTSGTMPKINQGVLLDIPIPLPPAPEQRRIAARVQSLMKLCDALEAALRRSEDRAAKLAEAVVQEMVAV
jgi:type I restriction enzyme S subunit